MKQKNAWTTPHQPPGKPRGYMSRNPAMGSPKLGCPLTCAQARGVLAPMGVPPGARTPAPRLGFGLMEVKVLISGLTAAGVRIVINPYYR